MRQGECLLYLGNASRIALVSRLKSHLSGSWLLIRKTKSSLLMGLPASLTRFSLQLRRIFCNTAASLKDFFRISARTFSSIFVRMKKKGLALFFYLSGQYDVVLGKSVACQEKKCMIFIQLHFLAVRFQVTVIWSSNSW